jgi:molecular chaperone GrpE
MSDHDPQDFSSTGADGRADGDPREPASIRSEADTTNETAGGSPANDDGGDASPAEAGSFEDQLEEARKQAAENYDRFVRAKADIENILKRHQRELSDRARYDGETLARDILQAVDDLERALEHSADTPSSVLDGVELVHKGLLAALKRNGVERIEAEGKPFDPAEHEAVTVVETNDAPANTVMSVFRAGYKMRDRLLRPAMVSVSKAPGAESQGAR